MVEQEVFKLPVLPLRDIVVFPNMIVRLFVGREKSVKALESVMANDQKIILATQKDASVDEPNTENIFRIGVLAQVLQILKLPDGAVKILVEGIKRIEINEFVPNEEFFEANAIAYEDTSSDEGELEALRRSVVEEFDKYSRLSKSIPEEAITAVAESDSPLKLADTVSSHIGVSVEKKQSLLEEQNLSKRLEELLAFMQGEMSVLRVEKKIKSRVKTQMEKTQKEYYLNEQMKAIQKELGDSDSTDELGEYAEKINSIKLSKEAKEKAEGELKKLKTMSPMSAEATVVRNYLDWIISVPWKKRGKVKKDLNEAQGILDKDHYGLEKIKERIIEFLAVQNRSKKMKGPILCLVGPPGVGKTSLGKSLAKATGREFLRISLGGVRDESEIRGHRRTYIGAMPGKIIQSMKKVKTVNPLILLDEIDKMGHDFRGDPASAMLEVLDPEQNSAFSDHYLEVEYDLSSVMFVTTANNYSMPRPLLDRMEIISLSGYTEQEKVEISKLHLLDKQMEAHGLKKEEFSVTDEALIEIVRYYTREAGVRNMERELAKLCRKSLTKILKGEFNSIEINSSNIEEFLGVKRFKYGIAEEQNQIGVTTGLAWTEMGGDLLHIEALSLPGKGKMKATGKLGDVMKESIDAASSYVRSKSSEFGVKSEKFEKVDIHVHVPEGATPKDGPSAGVGMVTSIVSVLTSIPVRKDVAMTGEITLRGNVLPIGGLKEKLLAALRGGIKTVVIPKDNVKDLKDIPDNVKNDLEIIPASHVNEVLKVALENDLKPLSADEIEVSSKESKDLTSQVPGDVTH